MLHLFLFFGDTLSSNDISYGVKSWFIFSSHKLVMSLPNLEVLKSSIHWELSCNDLMLQDKWKITRCDPNEVLFYQMWPQWGVFLPDVTPTRCYFTRCDPNKVLFYQMWPNEVLFYQMWPQQCVILPDVTPTRCYFTRCDPNEVLLDVSVSTKNK